MQDILDPIAAFLVWTFETVLVPLGNTPNTLFVLIGIVGIFYWLNLQNKLNKKAEQEGKLQ